MGRDNHNAGLHFVHRSRYGQYDDLEYYNNKAAEEYKNNLGAIPYREKKKALDYENKQKELREARRIVFTTYLSNTERVMTNIMYLMLKKGLDAHDILSECNKKAINFPIDPEGWASLPDIYRVMACISLICNKLHCSIVELFIDNQNQIRDYVYGIIAKLMEEEKKGIYSSLYIGSTDGWIDESGNAGFSISQYDLISGYTDRVDFRRTMDLSFERISTNDDKSYYSISYGDLFIHKGDVIPFGSVLLDEEIGLLKTYIEHVIQLHPEWKEE